MLLYLQQQQHTPAQERALAEEQGIPQILAAALLQRGITGREEVRAFLHPGASQLHDPLLLPGMQAAVARIRRAVESREKIAVYGDYDADGVCATAILLQYLQGQGANAEAYLPSRHGDGYGMHENGVRELHARGTRLIITVDNGISAAKEVALCYELGMKVIITDHHQCGDTLPACEAVINPHLPESTYPCRNLCGAGVVFKLVQALGGPDAAKPYLPLAALATVADVVELLGENRVIVALGLPLVAQHTGLRALLEVSGSAGQRVTGETLGFRLAPRLNAAGRMGDAGRALGLLLEQDETKAHALALELNDANMQRQQQEQAILREAQHMLQGEDTVSMRAIILYAPHWNPGVIGIVAARLRELYYRPVLLFHEDAGLLVGSCRSIPGVHLHACLSAHSSFFLRFGGHAQAAGITMQKELLQAFQAAFQAYLAAEIPQEVFLPTLYYEQDVQLSQLNVADVELLQALAPFGEGNPEPVFRVRQVGLDMVECMGKDRTHLRATAVQGRVRAGMVAFGYGNRAQEFKQGCAFDLLCTPSINEWQGNRRLQLQLRGIRPQSPLEQADAELALRPNFYDAFFVNFLYNGTQNAQWKNQAAWEEWLLQTAQGAYAGLLLLCFTPEGMQALAALLAGQGLLERFAVYVGRLPEGERYHSILLAPDMAALSCSGYTWVFSPDAAGPFQKGPVLQPGQQCIVADPPVESRLLAPLRIGREAMARYYAILLRAVAQGPQPRSHVLQLCSMAGYEGALLALLVFVELGFFRWEREGDTISAQPNCPRRDLMESGLYAAANNDA